MSLRRALPRALLVALLALVGCRDSPKEVIETATEAAAKGDLAALQETFSNDTIQRLERAWDLHQTPQTSGWQDLAQKLQFNGKPLEVKDETLHGDYAMVMTRAGVQERDYYLRKEDGHWKIELGAGPRYRAAAGAADKGGGGKEKKGEEKGKKGGD